jgi:hypothetical protein
VLRNSGRQCLADSAKEVRCDAFIAVNITKVFLDHQPCQFAKNHQRLSVIIVLMMRTEIIPETLIIVLMLGTEVVSETLDHFFDDGEIGDP